MPGKAELFLPEPGNPSSISGKKVNALARDSSGKIWIGLQETGLSRIEGFDKSNKPIFKNYLHSYGEKDSLQNERVSCLLVDRKNQLWVGTYKGLHLYNREKDNFQVLLQTENAAASISNNTILCLAEDASGTIWAGTQFGLNRITRDGKGGFSVRRYTTREGLPNDYIHAVEPDKKGAIWVSTNKGIVRLLPGTNEFAVFDKRDGIQSMIFSENASFTGHDGRLYFGGLEGLTYFHPDSIVINSFSPPLYFTNLSVNNQPVELLKYIRTLEDCLGRKAEMNLLPLQAGDVPDTWADIDDLTRDVGYTPATPVEVGIRAFVDWYLEYYKDGEPSNPRVVNLG